MKNVLYLAILISLVGLIVYVSIKRNRFTAKQGNADLFPIVKIPDFDEQLPAHSASPGSQRAMAAEQRVKESLMNELSHHGLHWGDPVFLRIFKEEKLLELFVAEKITGKFKLFRRYQSAAQSGILGPKLCEGDGQVPEGFYFATSESLRPDSRFHLAINCGYPNAYDRAHERTGSYIMIHGARVSIGCVAMTDLLIEEIYSLSAAAISGGQRRIHIHIFPFQMTPERMKHEENNQWFPFWCNLKEGYDWFKNEQIPPHVAVENQRYVFRKE